MNHHTTHQSNNNGTNKPAFYLDESLPGQADDPWMDAIAFSGGGMAGVCYAGVLKALEQYGYRKDIIYWSGSSVGSIIATLCVLGASAEYCIETLMTTDVSIFIDLAAQPNFHLGLVKSIRTYGKTIINLIEKLGIDGGDKFTAWFSSILQDLGYDPEITFQELYMKSGGKHLCITASSINTAETLYLTRSSYPHMRVIDAVRVSISLPYVFQPIYMDDPHCLHGRRLLADGGIYDNLPVNVLDIRHKGEIVAVYRKMVGFALVTHGKWTKDYETIDGILKYSYNFVEGMHAHLSVEKSQQFMYWDRVFPIECYDIASMDFNMNRESMVHLIETGYNATKYLCKRREQMILRYGPVPRNYFIQVPGKGPAKQYDNNDLWRTDLYETNPEHFVRSEIPANPNYNIK